MTTPQTVHDYLRRAFAPTPRGIVGLTEQLLAASVGGDIEFERIADRCVCRWSVSGETQEAIAPLPAVAFRTILGRIATLCVERHPDSATPYGGDALLATDSETVVQVVFVNTPDKQLLKLASVGARTAAGGKTTAERAQVPA